MSDRTKTPKTKTKKRVGQNTSDIPVIPSSTYTSSDSDSSTSSSNEDSDTYDDAMKVQSDRFPVCDMQGKFTSL